MNQRDVTDMLRGRVLTKAVPGAVGAGATPRQVERAARLLGYTQQAASFALLKAGVRRRPRR